MRRNGPLRVTRSAIEKGLRNHRLTRALLEQTKREGLPAKDLARTERMHSAIEEVYRASDDESRKVMEYRIPDSVHHGASSR